MTQQVPNEDQLDLARRLLAYEAGDDHGAENPAVFGATEKLRHALSRLVGTAGFRSLLARALKLASANAASLSALRINPNGSLDGLDAVGDHGQAGEAGAMLIAQLLALLALFIGDSLVFSLLSDIWPHLVLSETGASERKSI